MWRDLETLRKAKLDTLNKKFEGEKATFYAMSTAAAFVGTFATRYPLLWPVVGLIAYLSFSKIRGVEIGGEKFPLFGAGAEQHIQQHADHLAAKECHEKAAAFDRYISDLASIAELRLAHRLSTTVKRRWRDA